MLALNLVVRNEHNRIERCLTRAAEYCDELVVVDQDSDDDTRELAGQFGATVIDDECRGSPEASRPLAAAVTKSDWILVLDCDEHVVDDAIPEMLEIIETDRHLAGVQFSIGCYIDGERILLLPDGSYHPNVQLRMFRKGCVDYGLQLHERITMKDSRFPATLLPQRPGIMDERTHAEWVEVSARYEKILESR